MRTIDQQPVKSVGNGLTTPRDLVNDEDVYLTISMLAESVAMRLREHGMRAKTAQPLRAGQRAVFLHPPDEAGQADQHHHRDLPRVHGSSFARTTPGRRRFAR